jgi:S-(hydroxymethyl)glutathione dehydrogenase / alcohol dehydrogenase
MPTTTRAAVLWEVGGDWQVEEVDLDDPKQGDVLVKMTVAGLCHSEEHAVTGDMPTLLPTIGGHEGAGIVEAVGPGVTTVAPGDQVSMSFIPSCGRCRYCSSNRQYLCDEGAKLFAMEMMSDGRIAHRCKGEPIGRFAQLGTFAEHVLVSESSVIRVEPDLPAHAVALVSCGVATGFGSATERAGTRPGETVAVIGVGGIGMNAVQGARIAGASRVIAIDPVEFKRESAMAFGATHAYSSIDEALAAVPDLTWGDMCDRVVITAGVVEGSMIQPALALTSKGGTLVVTGLAPMLEGEVEMNLFMLSMANKEVKGTIFGSANPRQQIPNLLSMYRAGTLKLDELVTRRYTLDQINDGYRDMREGRNIRGVIEL